MLNYSVNIRGEDYVSFSVSNHYKLFTDNARECYTLNVEYYDGNKKYPYTNISIKVTRRKRLEYIKRILLRMIRKINSELKKLDESEV